MARFYYLVYVDVPDNDLVLRDEVGSFSPETLANIVMQERMGCDEDYGFDYTIDYERKD
jgi:hypothetical protein